jgi:ribonucleoside-diphosphate reductase alpha chain
METALTENAKTVIERRIAPKDSEGNPTETAEEVFLRVAGAVALADSVWDMSKIDEAREKFFGMMSRLDFLPNSPTLVNAGRPLGQLSACFVLPVPDSMEGIFESVKQAALIHKTGGGTGFSFSRLRAEGSGVGSTAGVASGPVSFMQVFDKATEVIKQGGTRRGANMGILRIDHPDIMKFIRMKDDNKTLQNFNISVAITDEFMDALKNEGKFFLRQPGTNANVGELSAVEVWDAITKGAHKTGDPGVVFIDRINSGKSNPVPGRGPIEATNPCGEQPLYAYDSCNLGSINLSNFVLDGKVDYARLSDVVKDAVHFLDNVIEINKWPNESIQEVSTAIRRIGLGIMGWADMLIKLKIRYGSKESIVLAESLMAFIQDQADQQSQMLGMKRGAFPDIGKSIYPVDSNLRNSTRTTIAPTGTISIIAGVSSGIEPVFAFEFIRSHYLDKDPSKRLDMKEIHPLLQDWIEEELTRKGVQDGGFELDIPEYFVSAHEVTPQEHIMMQAAFQAHTDNAVSKTINLPNDATVEDVSMAYKACHRVSRWL